MTRCPSEPDTAAIRARAMAWPGLKGVIPVSSTPSTLAVSTPTPQWTQLKLLLIWGALAGRFSLMPTMCCTTMQVCTTNTRKNTRKAPLPS